MECPHILVIDDSRTILKMVECHLSQAGYRVSIAMTAEEGVAAAESLRPNLILLDHQLPGTTGDEVCRKLLSSENTARIPVVISSAMRNRAFASYTEFANVVDQIPKPFTPDLLKTGVANALEVGAMVVQAQNSGCAMPDVVGEVQDAMLEGRTAVFPLRAVLDFLNNAQSSGRLTLEVDNDRVRFYVAGGRIQAVASPTIAPDRLVPFLPSEQADLAPLLVVTLGERLDPSMSGLVKMLERSLTDPRRLRSLLRTQSAILTHWALEAGPGSFSFEPEIALPPMFQAFPLQLSLPALAIDGIRRCDAAINEGDWPTAVFARQSPRGGNLDRAGLNPIELKLHSLLDGHLPLGELVERAGATISEAANLIRGLELVGMVVRREPSHAASVLVLDEDFESVRIVQSALGPQGLGVELKVVRDKVGAQLLMRRGRFDLVLIALDSHEMGPFLKTCREHCPETTRFIGITGMEGEDELARLDDLGLDGVLHRPLVDADLRATVNHLLSVSEPVGVA